MKMIYRAGILGIGAYILYRLIAKAKAVGGLILTISKIGFSLTADGVILTLMINARNDKAENILLNDIRGKIFINDMEGGTVNTRPLVTIPAESIITVPASVMIMYKPINDILTRIIEGKTFSGMTLRFEGTAKIEDIDFPVNLTHTIA